MLLIRSRAVLLSRSDSLGQSFTVHSCLSSSINIVPAKSDDSPKGPVASLDPWKWDNWHGCQAAYHGL